MYIPPDKLNIRDALYIVKRLFKVLFPDRPGALNDIIDDANEEF